MTRPSVVPVLPFVYVVQNVVCFEVGWRLAYKEVDDACQFLCHPIGDGIPIGHDGSWGCQFCGFCKGHKM